jgi:hypothetical protein
VLPFISLNAVTSTGPGTTRDLGGLYALHTVGLTWTGGPTSLLGYIEGSHDGVNFARISDGNGVSRPIDTTTRSSSRGHLVKYVRYNLDSLAGGSLPTATATIASGSAAPCESDGLPFTSLSSASGSGAVRDLEVSYNRHTMIVNMSGSSGSVTAVIQGSHDGVNFFDISNSVNNLNRATVAVTTTLDHVVRYVRAWSSDTATATVASRSEPWRT